MDRELEANNIWNYIDKIMPMFLIATRFITDYETKVRIANKTFTVLQIFKRLCSSCIEADYEKLLKHKTTVSILKHKKKELLNPDKSWNFGNIFDHLSQLEKEGLLYIGTPFELVDDILDKIPLIDIILAKNFELPNTIDPAVGRGRFVYSLKQRLLKEGFDEKEIIEHLYGIDIDPISALITSAIIDPKGLCEKSNIYCADTLNNYPKELKDMKFDVIVGNPPYQDSTGTKSTQPGKRNLYQKFTDISIELLEDNGILAFVTPPGIFKATVYAKRNSFFENMCKYDILYIDMDVLNYFNEKGLNIKTLVSYWILRKCKSNNLRTTIRSNDIIDEYCLDNMSYIPPVMSKDILSIINKLEHSESHFNFIRDKGYGSKKVLGLTRLNHINPNGKYQIHINKESDLNYDTDYAEELASILDTKLYRWANYVLRYDGVIYHYFLNGLTHPELSTKDVWTDKEIYEHFDLTKEEIKLIEETIKD